MKSLFYQTCRLSCFLIVLLAVACKKEHSQDEHNEELYTLSLKLNGFEAKKKSLHSGIVRDVDKWASTSPTQQDNDGYLFYWSFNDETLAPDIRVPSSEQTSITYNGGLTPSTYVNSTYSYGTHPAGKALSITGGTELTIEMPMMYVDELTSFGFDIGSTSTGPKDFEIYYSVDGISYAILQDANPFSSGTANVKNSFTYDLQNISGIDDRLWIKLELKAGDRTGASDYSPTSGVFRMDNIHLKGSYTLTTSATVSKLHYFIFHQDKPEIFATGEVEESDWGGFDVQLPFGTYDVFLISNQSSMELILPGSTDSWSTLFASNYFVNAQADIFGVVDEIQVAGDDNFAFSLGRMHSQIKFEFTDTDLSVVDKIVVTPVHDPFFFNPSGQLSTNPVLDQTEIVFDSGIQTNKQIVFNQFMGLLSAQQGVSYQLDVYSAGAIIRTLTVSSAMSNNMQLVFRGELLSGVAFDHGFVVTKNETWGGTLEETF